LPSCSARAVRLVQGLETVCGQALKTCFRCRSEPGCESHRSRRPPQWFCRASAPPFPGKARPQASTVSGLEWVSWTAYLLGRVVCFYVGNCEVFARKGPTWIAKLGWARLRPDGCVRTARWVGHFSVASFLYGPSGNERAPARSGVAVFLTGGNGRLALGLEQLLRGATKGQRENLKEAYHSVIFAKWRAAVVFAGLPIHLVIDS